MKDCEECIIANLCISKIQLFKDLNIEKTKDIYLSSEHKELKKSEIVFNIDDKIDHIIIIRHGKIKSSLYAEDGKEYIANIYVEGDIIGEDSIFLNQKFETNGIAIEDTGVCIIDKKIIKDLIVNDSEFSIKMIENLSNKLYKSQKLLEIVSIKDSYKRLAAFLLYRSSIVDSQLIELNQENIASSIAMSRETVSRKLTQLEKNGLIELLAYKKIHIKDKAELFKLTKI